MIAGRLAAPGPSRRNFMAARDILCLLRLPWRAAPPEGLDGFALKSQFLFPGGGVPTAW